MKTIVQPSLNGAKRPSTVANGSLTAFNPARPLDGSLILADVLRDQFNALNDDIQTRVEQSVFDTAMAGVSAEMAQHPTTQEMNSAIVSAIQNTAVNPMNVSPLYITISDPPTQSEVQQMLDRMNQLISALYRAP